MLVTNIINSDLLVRTSINNIYDKKVHLTANCKFFPEFDIKGILIGFIKDPHPILNIKLFKTNKIFKVDAMMNGLDLKLIE